MPHLMFLSNNTVSLSLYPPLIIVNQCNLSTTPSSLLMRFPKPLLLGAPLLEHAIYIKWIDKRDPELPRVEISWTLDLGDPILSQIYLRIPG